MRTVTSKDGTNIAYEQTGKGPTLILVVGAFNDRSTGLPLTKLLEPHFTVFNYDRRGRGDSGDTAPYAVEREIEDLDALIVEAGGSAFVFGYSSGAVLSLRAAAQGSAITKMVLYETPPVGPGARENAVRLAELVASGRRGDAVEYFQAEVVGLPPEVIIGIRNAPFRPALEHMAHTLVYELNILTDVTMPPKVAAAVKIPTLVVVGGSSPDIMRHTAEAVANAIPKGRYLLLEGQNHDIVPDVVAPVLQEFFTSGATIKQQELTSRGSVR